MRATMGLSWKSLMSKLHPPLAMSPRESARLLALLNTSFRQQLEKKPPAGSTDNEQHTDVHLRSILANPLFTHTTDAWNVQAKGNSLNRIRDILQRPMDSFKEQVAAGVATFHTAHLCLRATHNNCLASPDASQPAVMKTTGAGTIVLDWLWSSGNEDSGELLKQREFVRLLVRFLVAEEQHERLRQWLFRLQHNARESRSSVDDIIFRRILSNYVRVESCEGKGLRIATALFIEFVKMIRGKHEGGFKAFESLRHLGFYLALKLKETPKTDELQRRTLDPFIKAIKAGSHKSQSLLIAWIDFYLTEHPNPDAALKYFQGLSERKTAAMTTKRRNLAVSLGLETAEVYLDKGYQAEAVSIMKALSNHFANEIGSFTSSNDESEEKSSDAAEERSLQLLDCLATA